MTGSTHPHVQLLRDAYDAFAKGDFAALDAAFAEDVRWHEPGHNQLSGTHEGRPAVYDLFRRVFEITGGSFRADPQAVFADDTHGMVLVHLSGARDGRTHEVLSAQIVRFAGGRVAEAWNAHTDPDTMDRLLA
ncbi:nuclear transport factor 2 family protein [Geodermatophilus sp. URMC 62]|uniref:nuclear transport factor 2 family protein n=1 Tax=Geodermatophilus sp. URMC 62 TaxID=3423414 RepID=UPI00406C2ED6